MNPLKSFANQVMELRAKKVEIEVEINKALSAKEIAKKDAEQALQNVEAIKKDIGLLDKTLSDLINSSSSVGNSCKIVVSDYLKTIRESAAIAYGYIETLSQLQQKAIETKEGIEQIKKDQDSAWENIKNEEARLATLRDDLNIYKKRLEKLRDEVAPSVNIIV